MTCCNSPCFRIPDCQNLTLQQNKMTLSNRLDYIRATDVQSSTLFCN